MKKFLTAVLFAGFAVGCSGDTPTDVPAPEFAVAGNSGCYTVEVNSHVSGAFPSFSGTTTGDVVADISTQFDAGATFARGVVIGNEGITTWDVTGGIVEELWGKSFTLSQRNLVLPRPDNDPFLWEIAGNARAASGVSKANLTLQGTFDLGDFTPPFEVDLVWRGVICP